MPLLCILFFSKCPYSVFCFFLADIISTVSASGNFVLGLRESAHGAGLFFGSLLLVIVGSSHFIEYCWVGRSLRPVELLRSLVHLAVVGVSVGAGVAVVAAVGASVAVVAVVGVSLGLGVSAPLAVVVEAAVGGVGVAGVAEAVAVVAGVAEAAVEHVGVGLGLGLGVSGPLAVEVAVAVVGGGVAVAGVAVVAGIAKA